MSGNWDDRAAFCPVCGAALTTRELFGAVRKTCVACDYIQFRSPASAAAVLVARGRHVLLVKRGIEPYRGHWGLPAGFQEYWESPEEAAVREVREETGLQVALVRLLDVRYTRDDPRKRVNVAVYLAKPVAGVLQAADDAVAVDYFELDALPEKIAFANNREILAQLLRQYPHGDIQ